MSSYWRENILGVQISAVSMIQALQFIERWIEVNKQHYICVTPAHGVMDCWRDPELRRIFNASGLTTPDGMSIVWILKLLGHHHVERVYGPDLMLAVCDRSIKESWSHYFYGGAPGVPETLAEKLADRFPDLQVVGTYSPPFRSLSPQEDREIVHMIKAANPDIVWVGLSTPKQERWMAAHLEKLNTPVLIGVGAAFDFLSDRKKQAPRWIQRSGFEWLYRLASEPRRLWRRYARYPLFVLLVLAQLLGLKHYPD